MINTPQCREEIYKKFYSLHLTNFDHNIAHHNATKWTDFIMPVIETQIALARKEEREEMKNKVLKTIEEQEGIDESEWCPERIIDSISSL